MPEALPVGVDREQLRAAIREEYELVARDPDRGFHFHTGRPLAKLLGYREEWLVDIPNHALASFAGTGNPFLAGRLGAGERVLDVGCGAGFDTLLASHLVGASGCVVGVDMTPAMLERARAAVEAASATNVELRQGYVEALPVPDNWADVVISNGVMNLAPDKEIAFAELARVVKPGGRLQIGDLLVEKPVPEIGESEDRPLDRLNRGRSAGGRACGLDSRRRLRGLRNSLAPRRIRRRGPAFERREVRNPRHHLPRSSAASWRVRGASGLCLTLGPS